MKTTLAFNTFLSNFKPKISNLGKKRIIVLYGPPCSGKTTISKLLEEKYNLHRITFDLIRMKYFQNELLFTDTNNEEVLEVAKRIISFLISKNQSVICEGIFISNERKQLIKDIRSDACFIYLTASLNKLLSRLEERNVIGRNSEGFTRETMTKKQLIHFYENSISPCNDNIILNTECEKIEKTFSNSEKIIFSHYSIS